MSEKPGTDRREELLCPVCWEPLVGAERNGVEVEQCPAHGVWLDRGRLEAIVRRTAGELESYWARAVVEERERARHEDYDPARVLDLAGGIEVGVPAVQLARLAPEDRAHLEREYGPPAPAKSWIDSLIDLLLRRWP